MWVNSLNRVVNLGYNELRERFRGCEISTDLIESSFGIAAACGDLLTAAGLRRCRRRLDLF
jgi:hypothetical protein